MRTNLRLFSTGFLIALKHSSRRLLCLLCVSVLCVLLVWGYFSREKPPQYEKSVIGVLNLDKNPLSLSMINALLEGENLSQLIEVILLPLDGTGRNDCDAVLTIPQGFLENILKGENQSPILEVRMDSPLAALWIRQMALSGARALTAAQAGIYAVLDVAQDSAQYNLILADVNLSYLTAFFQRLSFLETRQLSASGEMNLLQYYIAALCAGLLFCYGFLFQPAIHQLHRFSIQVNYGRISLFCAAVLPVLLLQSVTAFLMLFVLYQFEISAGFFMTWGVLSLLSTGGTMLLSLIFSDEAACGAACFLLTFGQALLGGGLIPLPLLPETFTKFAPLLPLWHGTQLFAAPFGVAPLFSTALCMAILFFLLSLILWLRRGGKRI